MYILAQEHEYLYGSLSVYIFMELAIWRWIYQAIKLSIDLHFSAMSYSSSNILNPICYPLHYVYKKRICLSAKGSLFKMAIFPILRDDTLAFSFSYISLSVNKEMILCWSIRPLSFQVWELALNWHVFTKVIPCCGNQMLSMDDTQAPNKVLLYNLQQFYWSSFEMYPWYYHSLSP